MAFPPFMGSAALIIAYYVYRKFDVKRKTPEDGA
jgi:hypothetical protein